MSDQGPNDFAGVVRELAVLRQAVVELGIAQAEALNALAAFTKNPGPPGPTRNETASRVLAAAKDSLGVVGRLAELDDR